MKKSLKNCHNSSEIIHTVNIIEKLIKTNKNNDELFRDLSIHFYHLSFRDEIKRQEKRAKKYYKNEKIFINKFSRFIKDKIYHDFKDVELNFDNDKIVNFAKWIYKSNNHSFGQNVDKISLYISKNKLEIGSDYDKRCNGKTYDILDL